MATPGPSPGVIDAFGRALERLVDILTGIGGALLLAMLVLINLEVAGRYLFGFSTLIADEYGAYLLAWVTLLGAAYTLREERHLRVAMVVDRLPARWRHRIALGAAAVGLVVSAVALYAVTVLVLASWRMGTISIQPSATPLMWPQLALPLGYLVLGLAYVDEILRRATGRRALSDAPTTAGIDL